MLHHPILYFCRIVPSYRVPVLERLNQRLDGRLVVCAGQSPQASSLQSLMAATNRGSYRHVALRNYWMDGERLHIQPYGKAFQHYSTPAVVLAEESPRSLSLPFLLYSARRRRAGTVLWGHFSSNNRTFDPRRSLADRYRLWLAGRVDACVCYTEAIADLLRPHLPQEQLFVARNTLDTDTLFALYDRLAAEGKEAVRRRLHLPAEVPVLLFIGRLIAPKGTERLLDVFRQLRATQPAHLLVMGDGPERSAMEARVASEAIEDVHFLGALPAWKDSAPYLYAADVMLMPGYLGLAVNHAFSFGVPVVSQRAPTAARFHSPEVAFVKHGENGMLASSGNPQALLEAVRHVLAHQTRFSCNALRYARTHLTLSRMVGGLEAAIRFAEAGRATR